MLRKLIRVWIIGIVFPLYAIAGQPSVKITHGPYLQNLSENEVTVVWTTDKPCKSWVEFSKKEDEKFLLPTATKSLCLTRRVVLRRHIASRNGYGA